MIRTTKLLELFQDALAHILYPIGDTLIRAHLPRWIARDPLDVRQGNAEQTLPRLRITRLGLPHQVAKAAGLHATYYGATNPVHAREKPRRVRFLGKSGPAMKVNP